MGPYSRVNERVFLRESQVLTRDLWKDAPLFFPHTKGEKLKKVCLIHGNYGTKELAHTSTVQPTIRRTEGRLTLSAQQRVVHTR